MRADSRWSKDMLSNRLNLVLAGLLLSLTVGCVTLKNAFGPAPVASSPESKAQQNGPVVYHSGHSTPAIAQLDRSSWIEIRKSTKDDHIRMYATLSAGEFDAAIMESRKYLETHPKDEDALIVLAAALAMNRNYSLATYYGDLLEQYHPGLAITPNLRGLATLHRGNVTMKDFRLAASAFREAMDRNESEVAAALNLGNLYLETGNAKEAVPVFAGAKSRCGGCIDATIGLGIAFSHTASYGNARSEFEEVLAKNNSNTIALYRLALVEKNGFKNNARAKELLERMLTQNTDTNAEMKRRANVVLRRMQARDAAAPIAEDKADFEIQKQVVDDRKKTED